VMNLSPDELEQKSSRCSCFYHPSPPELSFACVFHVEISLAPPRFTKLMPMVVFTNIARLIPAADCPR
jgi:hypothetical protein